MNIKVDISMSGIDIDKEQQLVKSSLEKYTQLKSATMDYSDWITYPADVTRELIWDIENTAKKVRKQCTFLVVIGIGGSYLGAKAVIDAMNGSKDGCPEVIFAGYSMSAAYLSRIAERVKNEETCLCVVSKSGTTVEPLLVYNILKDIIYRKYGEKEAAERIYVITDGEKGLLRSEIKERGYKSFEVPRGIGGRYSVLTPAGLFPVAAAGHDINALIEGVKELVEKKPPLSSGENADLKEIIKYAVVRNALQNSGKTVEIFEYFESNLKYLGEWLKQLFAESEGKNGKGAFPTCLCFSRDLHSVGQFLQQGRQIFYETMIKIEEPNCDFVIPETAGEHFAGKTLEQINDCSRRGVIAAHSKGGIPIIQISIPKLNEYYLGQLIYFFEMACAVSAMNSGVNPFDQPGVDRYKTEMLKLIGEL